ncbi:MAG TPA: DUF2635 domain-containing protein [Acidiferrobacterales bacterium]|nr:DUF2635 domain-containing protein [Acidiferrobacterales bacterium]
MEQIHIKPNNDDAGAPLRVRLPERPGEFLPADGAVVDLNPHWMRRLNDGSVVRVEAKKKFTKE